MTCDITKIPGLMRQSGWNNGAVLMDEWFANPSNAVPASGTPDTSTIRMDSWVLTFERAKKVYDEMIAGKIWINIAAQKEIAAQLEKDGKFTRREERFGNLSRSGLAVDPRHIQERAVGSLMDTVDDMYAALGKFTLRMAIEGVVIPRCAAKSGAESGAREAGEQAPQTYTVKKGDNLSVIAKKNGITTQELLAANPQLTSGWRQANYINAGDVLTIPAGKFSRRDAPSATQESCDELLGWTVRINAFGIYVRDSYDFNGFQVLGTWDVSDWDPLGCVIFNSNFREWRSANGKGGDFLVFSDVKVTRLSPPDSFPVGIR